MLNKVLYALILFVFILFSPAYSFEHKDNPLFSVSENTPGIYVVEIDNLPGKHYLIPYVSDTRDTNKAVFDRTSAKLCINAGFFDFKNDKSVSYVTIYGEKVADPTENENLMNNPVLMPYLDKILNRSEFRIYETPEKNIVYDISPHDSPSPAGWRLKHSIQAGPMLLPELRLEEEFFVLKKDGKILNESAASLIKRERTAVGIKDNKVYFFVVTKSAAMSLPELAKFMKDAGMEKAMGFDGGGSTSLDTKDLHVVSENADKGRRVKSFILLF